MGTESTDTPSLSGRDDRRPRTRHGAMGPDFTAFVVTRSHTGIDAGPRRLSPDDLPVGSVTVRVDWSVVNYKDSMVVQPGNRVTRTSPLVPGVDLVGTVLESADQAVRTGDQVVVQGYDLGVTRHGGFSELARVPAEWVVPLPSGLPARLAAVIGTAGFTAAVSVHHLERQGLAPGRGPVLVTGASGGVGSMSVSLLAARGYEVVASTGKTSEHRYLSDLGAASIIDRSDLDSDVQRTLGAERWAGAVDCVGGTTLASVLRTLRYGAPVAASGLTGGSDLATTVYPFIVRGTALIGVDSVLTPIAERRAIWAGLSDSWSPDVLDRMVAEVVDLDGVADALERISAGKVRGRVLVDPSG
ncbi:MAG: acrylyl-CoA reductase family protein [Acidimicrobiales bacterium]